MILVVIPKEIKMFIEDEDLACFRLVNEYTKHNNIIIGVDFDDTIHDTFNRGLLNTGELISILKDLQIKYNCTLCVWTANPDEQKVRAYWEIEGLRIDAYNESPLKSEKFNNVKPYFNVLLDDRAGLDSTFKQIKHLRDYLKATK